MVSLLFYQWICFHFLIYFEVMTGTKLQVSHYL